MRGKFFRLQSVACTPLRGTFCRARRRVNSSCSQIAGPPPLKPLAGLHALAPRRVQALDIDALATPASDDEAHDFIAFFDDFHAPAHRLARARSACAGRVAGRKRRAGRGGRRTQRGEGQSFFPLEKRFHGVVGVLALGCFAAVGVSTICPSLKCALPASVRLRVRRWFDSALAGFPGSGWESA